MIKICGLLRLLRKKFFFLFAAHLPGEFNGLAATRALKQPAQSSQQTMKQRNYRGQNLGDTALQLRRVNLLGWY